MYADIVDLLLKVIKVTDEVKEHVSIFFDVREDTFSHLP